MQSTATIRYISGREEKFEVDLIGGTDASARLAEFVKNPSLVLRTEDELIIIPSTGIESVTLSVPDDRMPLTKQAGVRPARRVS